MRCLKIERKCCSLFVLQSMSIQGTAAFFSNTQKSVHAKPKSDCKRVGLLLLCIPQCPTLVVEKGGRHWYELADQQLYCHGLSSTFYEMYRVPKAKGKPHGTISSKSLTFSTMQVRGAINIVGDQPPYYILRPKWLWNVVVGVLPSLHKALLLA